MAENLEKETGAKFYLIHSPDQLSLRKLSELGVDRVFFPYWSHKIPEELYSRYNCIVFHMTDLPYGRGGSPLQNLIERGVYETKVTALKCTELLDAGPVYLKRPLSLHGSAEEIYIRASEIIEQMIAQIVADAPEPVAQEGDPVIFRRRSAADGDISHLTDLTRVYDYIRMLDADGYPNAFVEVGGLRFEFRRASHRKDCIEADVVIRRKD